MSNIVTSQPLGICALAIDTPARLITLLALLAAFLYGLTQPLRKGGVRGRKNTLAWKYDAIVIVVEVVVCLYRQALCCALNSDKMSTPRYPPFVKPSPRPHSLCIHGPNSVLFVCLLVFLQDGAKSTSVEIIGRIWEMIILQRVDIYEELPMFEEMC